MTQKSSRPPPPEKTQKSWRFLIIWPVFLTSHTRSDARRSLTLREYIFQARQAELISSISIALLWIISHTSRYADSLCERVQLARSSHFHVTLISLFFSRFSIFSTPPPVRMLFTQSGRMLLCLLCSLHTPKKCLHIASRSTIIISSPAPLLPHRSVCCFSHNTRWVLVSVVFLFYNSLFHCSFSLHLRTCVCTVCWCLIALYAEQHENWTIDSMESRSQRSAAYDWSTASSKP